MAFLKTFFQKWNFQYKSLIAESVEMFFPMKEMIFHFIYYQIVPDKITHWETDLTTSSEYAGFFQSVIWVVVNKSNHNVTKYQTNFRI